MWDPSQAFDLISISTKYYMYIACFHLVALGATGVWPLFLVSGRVLVVWSSPVVYIPSHGWRKVRPGFLQAYITKYFDKWMWKL